MCSANRPATAGQRYLASMLNELSSADRDEPEGALGRNQE